MPNPRRTTSTKKKKRNKHVASEEVRSQARSSIKKSAKTIAKAVETVAQATQGTPRSTQTYSQPRTYTSRTTTSSSSKTTSNKPRTSTTLKKANNRAKLKVTNTSAKSQYDKYKSSLVYKTIAERQAEAEKKRDKKGGIDYTKAYNKGKDLTYLGTKQKETETALNNNNTMDEAVIGIKKAADKKAYYKSDEYKKAKKEIRKEGKKAIRSYLKEQGYSKETIDDIMASERGKQAIEEQYQASLKAYRKAVNKQVNKNYAGELKKIRNRPETLKSVNALTRGEFNRVQEASRYGKKMGDQILKGGNGTGKDIREKVGSKTAESALKGKAATGFMQGMSYVDLFSNSVGKYNKSAKAAIKKTKESGAYNVGYGAGMMAQMGLGGVNSLGRSVASAGAKQVGKSAGKKFLRNRAGELVAETPMNIADAAKMATDENGKIDTKELAKWMAVNTGLTAGMGGAIEGIGGAITKSQAKKMTTLLGKQQARTITDAESQELDKLVSKLRGKAKTNETISSNIAEGGLESRRKTLTASANDLADNANKGRAEFQTSVNNRRAKVEAQKNYDKKAVHLENNVKQAKKTRDTLQNSLDEMKSLRKKEGTMGGHQEIVDRYGSVEHLDVVIRQTESALKKSRQRLREVQTNLGTEKKRLQRANAKIDEQYPLPKEAEAKAEVNAPKETEIRGEDGITYKVDEDGVVTPKADPQELKANASKAKSIAKGEQKKLLGLRKKLAKTEPKTAEHAKLTEELKEQRKAVRAADDARKGIDEQIADIEEASLSTAEREKNKLKRQLSDTQQEIKNAKAEYNWTRDEFGLRDKNKTSYEKLGWWQKEIKDLETYINSLEKEEKTIQGEIKKLSMAEEEARREASGGFNSVDPDEFPELKDDGTIVKEDGTVGYANTSVTHEGQALVAKPEGFTPDEMSKMVKDGTVQKYADSKDVSKTVEKSEKLIKDKDGVGKAHHIVRRIRMALFDNLAALEDAARGMPLEQRNGFLAQINNMRKAQKTAQAKMVEEGKKIYKDFGLDKPKNAEKKQAFEYYCLLKHDIDMLKTGADGEFLGLYKLGDDPNVVIESIENTLKNFEKEYKGIDKFQERVTKYFDSLLDLEVDAGITSAKEAEQFRKLYPNYLPKYVQQNFDEVITANFREEINVGRGMKRAKGGKASNELVPLYDVMLAKTNAVMKRTELNRTMNFLASAMGVEGKDLRVVAKQSKMDEAEVLDAVMDVATFTPPPKGGQYKVWYFKDGGKVEMNVSKDVYDGIRDWSGEDKMMILKGTIFEKPIDTMLNNPVIQSIASGYKKLITDYNLYFGVKNFARDIETALFYTKDINGYVKAFPKAIASMLPTAFVPKSWRIYKEVFEAYKKNGGVYSQLITASKLDTNLYQSKLKYFNAFKYIEDMNSALETLPRMAEFISAIEANTIKRAGKKSLDEFTGGELSQFKSMIKDTLSDPDAIADAMYRAKDVTLNFDRSGWLGKQLNRGAIPFFNPSMQGLSKLQRILISDNNIKGVDGHLNKQASALHVGFTIGKLMGMVALPTFGIEIAFSNFYDGKVDGYGALSDYNRYAYYNIPAGDGKYVKIPRARELASMQATVIVCIYCVFL